jgi:hypothetical protein
MCKIDINHQCFSTVPPAIIKQLENDDQLEAEPVFGFDDDEQLFDVMSEFDGGCIMLYGVPESALIDLE